MVKWSDVAIRNLKEIHDYIAVDSIIYAKDVVLEIVNQSEIADKFPRIGRVVPEINNPKIREVFVYSYRLMYRIADGGIEILSLVHGKMNFKGE
jgi:toxin ParE1/3/4